MSFQIEATAVPGVYERLDCSVSSESIQGPMQHVEKRAEAPRFDPREKIAEVVLTAADHQPGVRELRREVLEAFSKHAAVAAALRLRMIEKRAAVLLERAKAEGWSQEQLAAELEPIEKDASALTWLAGKGLKGLGLLGRAAWTPFQRGGELLHHLGARAAGSYVKPTAEEIAKRGPRKLLAGGLETGLAAGVIGAFGLAPAAARAAELKAAPAVRRSVQWA